MLSKQSTFCSNQFKVMPEKVSDDVERFGRCFGKIVRVYYLPDKPAKLHLHKRLRGHGSLLRLSRYCSPNTSSATTDAMVVVSLPALRPLHSPGSIYVANTTRDDPSNPSESDLLKTLRALVQPPDQEHRVVTNASTNSEGENELYWHANTVIWSVGGVQKRRWNFEDERQGVTAACFAWLEGSKMSPDSPRSSSRRLPTITVPPKLVRSGQSSPSTFGPFTHLSYTNPLSGVSSTVDEAHPNHMRVICIFLRDIGYIYSLDGLEFTLNIPFTIHRVWEILPVGILLQAALTDADEAEVRSRGMPMVPSLYSLTSPFDELRAIVFASEIIGGFQCAKPGRPLPGPHPRITRDTGSIPLVRWHDKILYVSPNSMVNPTSPDRILVTLDPRAMTLKMFRYVYVKRNDRPGPLRQNASPKKYPFEPGVESMTTAENQEKRIHDLISSIDFPTNMAGKAPNTELDNLLRASESHLEASTRRRSSHSRNDLSMTLDRMAIGGTGADEFGTVMETGRAKVKPIPTNGPTTYANNKKIKGEIFVEKIWECPVDAPDCMNPDAISVSMFDTRLTHACIAISVFSPQPTVHILRLEAKEDRLVATYIQSVPAVSAVPVQATRSGSDNDGLKDLLCLRPDGSMFLLCPGGTVDVQVESNREEALQMTVRDDRIVFQNGSGSRRAVRLMDSIRSSVTVVYSDNTTLRISTDLTPHGILVQSSFITLSHTCSSSLLWMIRLGYLRRWSKFGRCGNSVEEFQCFSAAVLDALKAEEAGMRPDANEESDAWSLMGIHEIHNRLSNDIALRHLHLPSPNLSPTSWAGSDHPEKAAVLHGLHLLGEELKADNTQQHALPMLVPLLVDLAVSVGADWADYWLRIYPDATSSWNLSTSINILSPIAPPDLAGFLYSSLGAATNSQVYPGLSSIPRLYNLTPSLEYGSLTPLPLTEHLLPVYAALKDSPILDPSTTRERAYKAVSVMIERHMTAGDIDRLPFGIAAPLREALRTCQNNPPADWDREAYILIGRNDIAKMISGASSEIFSFGDAYQLRSNQEKEPTPETIDIICDQSRMMATIRHFSSRELDPNRLDFAGIRFSEDQRLAEVDAILDSSKVQTVKIPERPDLNEHDLTKELAATVHHIVERTFALSFGRAIYTFGSVSRLTRDEYIVPELKLDVKFVPHNVTYPPDPTKIHPEAKQWAEFHNGVAAALRLNPSAQGIDSSWIAFNKPHDLNAEHAGYLLGLGLTGHLRNMWNWHGYRYLVPKHEPTSIAVLLGLGAAHIGSADPDVTRLLTIHMRPLLPPDSAELGIPLGAQSASLMGLGLLYLGTADRSMAEVALEEMSASQQVGGPEISNEHKEAYTITAALAFGMIMCGLGSKANTPSDVINVTKLRAFIAGKEPVELTKTHKAQATPTSINLNFVSPAATIALALMYLKTNRADIAATFALPPDPAGLRDIQPNLLLLRALGRSLVMWDDIAPNVQWVLSQAQRAPKDMTKKQLQEGVKDLYEYAFFNILSGACLAIGLKYAGTATTAANHVLIHFHDKLLENLRRQPSGQTFDLQLRRSAIREAINMVDLALGIVMAGTGDVVCMQRFRVRHGLFGPQFKYGAHIATHMALGFLFLGGGRYTLGTSNAAVACLVAALYPRFPLHSNETRGLLQAFRHLWVLAVEPRCLIARDADTNEIARIPIKIKISEGPDDPVRTHHFVCPTLLPDFNRFVSLKVDSPRYWPFVFNIANNPRNRDSLLRSQTIYVKRRTGFLAYANDPMGFQSLSIWNGTPIGDPSILDFPLQVSAAAAASATNNPFNPWLPKSFSDMRHFTPHSTNDAQLLAFADRFCRLPGRHASEAMTLAYAQQSLLDVLSGDKPQILPSLLALYHARVTRPEHAPMSALSTRDIHLANEFYALLFRLHGGLVEGVQRQPLMRVAALQGSIATLSMEINAFRLDAGFVACYRAYARGEDLAAAVASSSPGIDGEQDAWILRMRKRQLAFFLLHERVPSAQTLAALRMLANDALITYRANTAGGMGASSGDADASSSGAARAEILEPETLRIGLILVVQKTAMSLAGPRTTPWTLQSVREVLDFWTC